MPFVPFSQEKSPSKQFQGALSQSANSLTSLKYTST